MPSWALWAKALLATGSNAHMSRADLDDYFHVPPGFNVCRGGWFSDGPERFHHNGNNGWSYAWMRIDRHRRLAAVAATNIGYEGVATPVKALMDELDGMGQAWPAMEHLAAALAPDELRATASSEDPDHPAPNAVDDSFRSRWVAATATPVLTLDLLQERWFSALLLCQSERKSLGDLELELVRQDGSRQLLKGAALRALTVEQGLVIELKLPAPQLTRHLILHVKTHPPRPSCSA